MDPLIVDPRVSEPLIEERRARAADRFDEVWEGAYVMGPAPGDEHQEISTRLARPFLAAVEDTGLGKVRMPINLATDPDDWEQDYRVPGLTVFLNDSPAVCHGAFWSGPPAFVIEVIGPWDKTRNKCSFYAEIGTRELLIIDQDPWQLELCRLKGTSLVLAGSTTPADAAMIHSEVLPMAFRLLAGSPRPTIEVTATDLERTWTI
jgi:Uma2 family endonuclease